MSRVNCPNCSHHSYHIAPHNDVHIPGLLMARLILKFGFVPASVHNLPIQCDTCSYSWKA